jgi:hypothetical protein
MKHCCAVVTNQISHELVCILEQDRVTFNREFVDHAVAWAFLEACERGIDGRRITIEVSVDGRDIAVYDLVSEMCGSSVYAYLYVNRLGCAPVYLRRMVIAD